MCYLEFDVPVEFDKFGNSIKKETVKTDEFKTVSEANEQLKWFVRCGFSTRLITPKNKVETKSSKKED